MDEFQIKSVFPESDSDANTSRSHSSETLPGRTEMPPTKRSTVSSSLAMNAALSATRFLEGEHVTKPFGILTKKPAFKQHFFLTVVERCYSPSSKYQWFISIMAKKNRWPRTVWMDYSIAGSCSNESPFPLSTPPFFLCWVASLLEGRHYEEETF